MCYEKTIWDVGMHSEHGNIVKDVSSLNSGCYVLGTEPQIKHETKFRLKTQNAQIRIRDPGTLQQKQMLWANNGSGVL